MSLLRISSSAAGPNSAWHPDPMGATTSCTRQPAAALGVFHSASSRSWQKLSNSDRSSRNALTASLVTDAVEPLVDYYRSIAGEHPDWAEYRQAMVDQGKCLIRITPQRWGPVATGGFPPQ
jgi:hypothetical protein